MGQCIMCRGSALWEAMGGWAHCATYAGGTELTVHCVGGAHAMHCALCPGARLAFTHLSGTSQNAEGDMEQTLHSVLRGTGHSTRLPVQMGAWNTHGTELSVHMLGGTGHTVHHVLGALRTLCAVCLGARRAWVHWTMSSLCALCKGHGAHCARCARAVFCAGFKGSRGRLSTVLCRRLITRPRCRVLCPGAGVACRTLGQQQRAVPWGGGVLYCREAGCCTLGQQ